MKSGQSKPSDIVTVLGQRGSGKSSWVKQNLPGVGRFIVWDTMGEYASPEGKFQGFKECEDLSDVFVEVDKNQNGLFQLVYTSVKEDEQELKDLEAICTIAGAVGGCLLVIEEVDTYADPHHCPLALKTLLKKGRHWDVSMMFVSRRPAEIHRLITSQSQRFILFKIIEPRDIIYLRSIIGQEADQIPSLEILHYMDWNQGKVERGIIHW